MKKLLSIFAIVASLFIIGCASAATPSDAAVNIYELIAKGEYDAAVAEIHCEGTAEEAAEEAAELRATLAALFKEKAAPQIESKGGIASCEAVAERISENGQEAVVTLKITYGNGSVEENDLDMILTEEGCFIADATEIFIRSSLFHITLPVVLVLPPARENEGVE